MDGIAWKIGQVAEWIMRPLADGGHLSAIVVKLGPSKIGIAVQSPKTGDWRPKWVHPTSLRQEVHNDPDE